jgi:hypothetical protein
MRMLRRRLPMLVLCLVLFTPACAQNAPPNLSPAGVVAWQGTKVIKALDVIRDIAVDAEATAPPLLSHATMLKIVAWHKAAITTAHAAPAGWSDVIKASLRSTLDLLTPAERQQLSPYFALAETLLNEVH